MITPRVLVAGHVTHDRYDDGLLAGGSGYYAGHAARALGAEVALVTTVGEDFVADAALAGLEVHAARAGATTTFANAYAPDGTRRQRLGACAPPIAPTQVPPVWRVCDVLHLAPVMGELDLGAWRGAVRARLVGLGVQGCVRAVGADGVVVPRPFDLDAAAGLDVAFVGEDDLVGQGDLVERLAPRVPLVAFTHGARGCDLIVRGRSTRVGVYATTEVDPTGAGDVFAAGLLLGLARGAAPGEAARLGAAAASVIVEGRGGATLARVGEAFVRARAIDGGGG